MKDDTIATVYASALLGLAAERGELEALQPEIQFLLELPQGSPQARAFLESPGISRGEKARVLESVLRGRLSDTLVNFLLLVVQKGRQVFLLKMLREFVTLYEKRAGIVRVAATTAVPLSAANQDALRKALEVNVSGRVILENRVDPELLGGLIVRYEGKIADDSLRTALNMVAARLLSLKFGSQLIHANQS